jgi:hypothetical protein
MKVAFLNLRRGPALSPPTPTGPGGAGLHRGECLGVVRDPLVHVTRRAQP